MNSLQNEEFAFASGEFSEDTAGAQAQSIDFLAIVSAVLRRWKLILAITLLALVATYGVLKLVPSRYKSTVEILVYDPQQEINAAVQKPISPFVDALGSDAMRTEINILTSKSVALRVANELGLDKDPEFQSHGVLEGLAERLGFTGLAQTLRANDQSTVRSQDERAERMDEAADALLANLGAWGDAYTLFVTTTSESPAMAQRLAATIATDYLVTQREARQEALQRVSDWLKGRVDNLQSSVLVTEAAIAKLKADNNIRDSESNNFREKQIGELNNQIMKARADVDEKSARLDQVRSVLDSKGDIQGIAELTASPTLTTLRQKQAELTSRAADLQRRLGDGHLQVIATRAELAAVTQQMNDEVQHILGNMKNAYDIAMRQEQALETSLQTLTAHANSGAYIKLSQLQSAADADRKLYEGYLAQYNDITERRTLQTETARIISPATYPLWPSSPKRKVFFAVGGAMGLGGGILIAFLLEYFLRPGVRTGKEVEQSFGRPVVGIIPLMKRQQGLVPNAGRLVQRMVNEPLSDLSESVRSLRIGLELSHNNAKVILMTSAIPGEGKSTIATLLAASSASSGKKTILVDCDLHNPSISNALPGAPRQGLSEVLRGKATLEDVMIQDPVSKVYVVPAGSLVTNAADLLMSQQMRDIILRLRAEFDYVVVDTAPLLPVIDALVLTSLVDRVLVIVEWSQTPRINIAEASKLLRPESHRIAGVILNKVDVTQLPPYGYRGGYYYGSAGKFARNK
jgi:succinoglycan biosynthesis transport protein ExoP